MSRKIVITGGAGFIGSALARALVARGDDVSCWTTSLRASARICGPGRALAVIEGDILDAACWTGLRRRGGRVSRSRHPLVPRSLAAPVASHNANARHPQRARGRAPLPGSARGLCRLVLAYGEPPSLPVVETMAPAPLSPYAVSKLAVSTTVECTRGFSACRR